MTLHQQHAAPAKTMQPPVADLQQQESSREAPHGTLANMMHLQRTIGNQAVAQMVRRTSAAAVSSAPAAVIQRALTLDNADFSGVTSIKKLGGNAEGAFLVDDGSGKVVVKISDSAESTVMAYNLAKDFGIRIPSARYLELKTESGQMLIEQAGKHNKELESKLEGAKAITMWEFIKGDTIDHFKNKSVDDKEVQQFRQNPENFIKLGKMLVFDAAILNEDRFKIAFDQPMNPGNLMVAGNQPVGLDQDFAHIDGDSTPQNNLEDYGDIVVGKLQPLLANPDALAVQLVSKMVKEGYALFADQQDPIAAGIKQGVVILRNLADTKNLRLEKLIEWSKTFTPDSKLDPDTVRGYWNGLLGSE
ncbi:hypothetical protein B5M42_008730 [Paenibacillus athensensis]|uniref:Actin-fragmin kinase catalytic domain-containing protein n=1 Tax=Paenibacillus athensensis TaxID=1967502 RepID=A0A4Y8QAE4_9BACL|nr:hypothetical protein [Paenibacillus athensensis]MCD1258920.1 hypothetical protein [Paenibacillus athensensis]